MKKTVTLIAAFALAAAAFSAAAQNDWQSRKNRENAATSASSITNNGGTWDAKAEAEREAIARQQRAQRLQFTGCDQGACYDTQGGIWHKSGADVLNGPNGRTCFRSGSVWNCN